MKCYIRKIQTGTETFYARHIGYNQNHWVIEKREAQQFGSVAEARWIIKQYDLKNCEVRK
jgi:hypothetical protein